MSKALVLGGGGPVGIGWETGLIVGLESAGIRLADADLVVGTSAGSVVGAHLRLGSDLVDLVNTGIRAPAGADAPGVNEAMSKVVENLMMAVADALSHPGTPEEARAQLGRFALDAQTVPEADFLAVLDTLAGKPWPDGFKCTTVDAHSGEYVIWDETSDVDVQHAVASSCSVPGIFPPVTIHGRSFVDGGMRTTLNADAAMGHDAVLVISVMPIELPEGMSDPMLARLDAARDEEFAKLRAAGATLEIIAPNAEFLEISGWGLNLMDFSRTDAAFDAGVRQAAEETDRIRSHWVS